MATEALSVAGMAAVSYASTNVDNLVILLAYRAKPGYRPFYVGLTFVSVCLLVLFVSLALAAAAQALAPDKIRYLGLVPIGYGCHHLLRWAKRRAGGERAAPRQPPGPIGIYAYFGFAVVLLANSSDSISLMTPILADLKAVFVVACFAGAATMAVLLGGLAHVLARSARSRPYLEALERWVLPFLLIAVGILVLTDTPTDLLIA